MTHLHWDEGVMYACERVLTREDYDEKGQPVGREIIDVEVFEYGQLEILLEAMANNVLDNEAKSTKTTKFVVSFGSIMEVHRFADLPVGVLQATKTWIRRQERP